MLDISLSKESAQALTSSEVRFLWKYIVMCTYVNDIYVILNFCDVSTQ